MYVMVFNLTWFQKMVIFVVGIYSFSAWKRQPCLFCPNLNYVGIIYKHKCEKHACLLAIDVRNTIQNKKKNICYISSSDQGQQ